MENIESWCADCGDPIPDSWREITSAIVPEDALTSFSRNHGVTRFCVPCREGIHRFWLMTRAGDVPWKEEAQPLFEEGETPAGQGIRCAHCKRPVKDRDPKDWHWLARERTFSGGSLVEDKPLAVLCCRCVGDGSIVLAWDWKTSLEKGGAA
jgi:hypothetical protein